jgi:hypothetical protein
MMVAGLGFPVRGRRGTAPWPVADRGLRGEAAWAPRAAGGWRATACLCLLDRCIVSMELAYRHAGPVCGSVLPFSTL